jgi:tRNA pseudouridine55 synthase
MDHFELGGVLVVDKPAGLTSAGVVGAVKRLLQCKRAGHTGTLDPLATGVLPICLGEATKAAGLLIADDKAYEAELELGATTDTLDAYGAILTEDRAAAAAVTADDVRAALLAFAGRSQQMPPMYSAIKQNNRRLYTLAREGQVVERESRAIEIHRLELLSFDLPRARIAVECSKGTFVRSLIDDLGRALGCGAHLTALRRTRCGPFALEHAVRLEDLPHAVRLVRMADALVLPRIEVPRTLREAVWHAHPEPLVELVATAEEGQRFQLVSEAGDLLALCRRVGPRIHFDRVFRAP